MYPNKYRMADTEVLYGYLLRRLHVPNKKGRIRGVHSIHSVHGVVGVVGVLGGRYCSIRRTSAVIYLGCGLSMNKSGSRVRSRGWCGQGNWPASYVNRLLLPS